MNKDNLLKNEFRQALLPKYNSEDYYPAGIFFFAISKENDHRLINIRNFLFFKKN